MQRLKPYLFSAVLVSELSHVFCCGIPLVFSLFSLLAGAGALSAMPLALSNVHEMMHPYEIPMIIFSGVMLFLGWGLHLISERIDCHDTGCGHPPCTPKKRKSAKFLLVATILFAVNVSGYFVFHDSAPHPHDVTVRHEHAD